MENTGFNTEARSPRRRTEDRAFAGPGYQIARESGAGSRPQRARPALESRSPSMIKLRASPWAPLLRVEIRDLLAPRSQPMVASAAKQPRARLVRADWLDYRALGRARGQASGRTFEA